MTEYIELIHARENNLKNIDLRIPKNKLLSLLAYQDLANLLSFLIRLHRRRADN